MVGLTLTVVALGLAAGCGGSSHPLSQPASNSTSSFLSGHWAGTVLAPAQAGGQTAAFTADVTDGGFNLTVEAGSRTSSQSASWTMSGSTIYVSLGSGLFSDVKPLSGTGPAYTDLQLTGVPAQVPPNQHFNLAWHVRDATNNPTVDHALPVSLRWDGTTVTITVAGYTFKAHKI